VDFGKNMDFVRRVGVIELSRLGWGGMGGTISQRNDVKIELANQ
jgi:hypothetical protein